MSEPKDSQDKYSRAIWWFIIFAAVVYIIVRTINVFGNVLLVLLGFGAVVLVHEFGHFVVAKLAGIKVEAFSIFMPPTLFGVQRTADGLRFRILPKLFANKDNQGCNGLFSFTIGNKGKAGETEYRIGCIPFGGFVKLLGQEDTGPVKASDDPRSFANKPFSSRAAVLAAGVVFNTISAMVIFMIVFLVGIDLPPAVVGDVLPDSPAARAGLKAGDEIIEIAGKNNDLDFSNIGIAAALSGRDEEVALKVRHEDGSEEDLTLVAERLTEAPMRLFGILPASSLTIAEVSDADKLQKSTNLLPGDRVIAVNGKEVKSHWELVKVLRNTYEPSIKLSAERIKEPEKVTLVESEVVLEWGVARGPKVESESELSHIYSMVPRLCVAAYARVPDMVAGASKLHRIRRNVLALIESTRDKILSVFGKRSEGQAKPEPPLRAGDIILAAGDVNNPTYLELRDCVTEHKDKELPVKILRADANGVEETLTVTVTPKQPEGSEKVFIGVELKLDNEHPVIAKTISAEVGPAKLAIPPGAAITAIDGVAVLNFYDIAREISRCAGERITIDYRLDEQIAGNVVVNVSTGGESITVEPAFAELIPFKDLKKLYRASGPAEAVAMGCKKTVMFIAQTYVTLRRLIGGLVSPKDLMGPLGIIALSYHIVAEQPLVYYVYFLGLISAVIAVFNFLPLPPLDGGLVLLLLVEKIKGSSLSERTQGAIAYVGWAFILALLLYITFNDIVRTFFS
jgi:regulator of sigma E protease